MLRGMWETLPELTAMNLRYGAAAIE